MRLLLLASAWCAATANAQRHARPERPALDSMELHHLGKGIQFKIQKSRFSGKLLKNDDVEAKRIHTTVQTVKGVVAHLTNGMEPVRVFRHAGIHEQKHVDAGLHLWYRLDMAEIKEHEGDDFAAQKCANRRSTTHTRAHTRKFNVNLPEPASEPPSPPLPSHAHLHTQLFCISLPRLPPKHIYHNVCFTRCIPVL